MLNMSCGNWNNSSNAGVFNRNWNNYRSNSNNNVGFRSAFFDLSSFLAFYLRKFWSKRGVFYPVMLTKSAEILFSSNLTAERQ